MIRKEGVRITYTCDGCGQLRIDQDGVRAQFKPHKQVWQEASAEGWTAKKKETVSDYDHFCQECSNRS